mmetsp:Transcript_16271/g.21292  ORF Transcript_16271/g.21292 Transcript_16271/m.21292 type:complete len:409 (+) Transcript_16271:148-1374(+)|eukprot:CAMPEP_0198147790 /NCGR_PEP_ID=MMETSP1443-20131203/37806_1 /TAXON_ID=186043 /ORGANISM="Entomoneis sp., Strain CCMP2396" /LENGTH=408 /DNA_ID=CAMNT_0043812267 /DNA_START=43 /DNA_END=1269 /DNA_ORIENTATION=-
MKSFWGLLLSFIWVLAWRVDPVHTFILRIAPALLPTSSFSSSTTDLRQRLGPLFSGTGIARDYRWQEEAFEIDVTLKVPKDTRAKDVQFKASPKSIDLKYTTADGDTVVLLDGDRPLRGRVSMDGTYWVISDVTQDKNMPMSSPFREITVTIEKTIKTPKDDFEVVEYDWKGVYLEEKEEEVSYRKYDGPEQLDVKEYAAGLGVDLDNLNMSAVDKTMFSAGLNLTQSSMDELTKAGVLKEVTQQSDGSEFIVNSETGEPEALTSLGRGFDGDGDDNNTKEVAEEKKIPFLDTNSPWHNTIAVNETDKIQEIAQQAKDGDGKVSDDDNSVVQQKRHFTRAAFAEDAASASATAAAAAVDASDPIELLKVKKLKEILKSQGLKVSGNKKDLQDRLRQQVNSLIQGNQQL